MCITQSRVHGEQTKLRWQSAGAMQTRVPTAQPQRAIGFQTVLPSGRSDTMAHSIATVIRLLQRRAVFSSAYRPSAGDSSADRHLRRIEARRRSSFF